MHSYNSAVECLIYLAVVFYYDSGNCVSHFSRHIANINANLIFLVFPSALFISSFIGLFQVSFFPTVTWVVTLLVTTM